jgi:hypothetical protein
MHGNDDKNGHAIGEAFDLSIHEPGACMSSNRSAMPAWSG